MAATPGAFKMLIYSKTAGFRHASIPDGIAAMRKLGETHGFSVEATEDSTFFSKENLARFKVVMFLSTTLDVLSDGQQAVFQDYIRSGGGFVGIHAAADTEYGWPWYGKLVGAYFESHPQIQEAIIRVKDQSHISTKHLPADWKCTDEWYNFKNINPDIHVLCQLDETTYQGGKNGANHPIAWYHAYEGGRAFYTARGHTSESFSEPLFLEHIWGGIQYAAGFQHKPK
jgi:type 1 glutamine amidotransferase